jgi:murein DD-endopeptidase MepM/ murein hydrolase activator NlpD
VERPKQSHNAAETEGIAALPPVARNDKKGITMWSRWREREGAVNLLRMILLIDFVVIFLGSSVSFPSENDPATEWHQLYTRIRDGQILKQEAQSRLRSLEVNLKDSYPDPSRAKDEKPLCFPLEGYGSIAIGGKEGSGYKIRGYDFFDGDRHRGHPGHDIFIRDRDQDGLDDATGRPVNVISSCSGIVVSTHLGWDPSSRIRGGNYIWLFEPIMGGYHYYAHLNEIFVNIGQIVARGERIGTVGRTGKNAYPRRSPTHLHFTVHQSEEGNLKPVNPYKELVREGCQ